MNIYLKALAASVFALAAASASASVNVRIYAGAPPPVYAPVHVRPYVVQQPYYGYRDVYVEPSWQARREYRLRREREWRRAEWERREAMRRHYWRMEHRHRHHHYDRGYNDGWGR